MKTLQIHRLTPVLFLTLMALFTACNGLTGIDPDATTAPALDARTALRTAQIQDEPVVRKIPEFPGFTPPDEIQDETPFSFKVRGAAPVLDERRVELGAAVVAESFRSITVRFSAHAEGNNLYYVLRQIEGQAPVLVRYFNGSSLPTVTETLAKDDADRWVEYWITDDGGAEITARIRFDLPARALP